MKLLTKLALAALVSASLFTSGAEAANLKEAKDVRIAFVVLTFAGGVGALAYIGLLAFVPADDDSRVFGSSREANLIGAVVLGIIVCLLVGPPAFFLGPVLIPVALLIGLGLALWKASGGRPPSPSLGMSRTAAM